MRKFILLSIVAVLLSGCGNLQDPITPESTQNPTEYPSATAAPPTEVPYVDLDTLSTKVTGWGFVRKKGSEPEVPAAQQEELQKYGGYYIGNREKKEIYLTFDEGYENGYTAKILDVLHDTGVPAAFFVTGPYLEGQQELVQRMISEGHVVGNHTIHHPNLGECSDEKIKEELDGLNEKCEKLYGVKMQFMRPPEGAYSERSLVVTQNLGYKTILWSHAYKDWDVNFQPGAENAIKQVVPYFHNGEILLLHAVSKDNAEALADMITAAREQGYEFKSLNDLE